VADYEIPDDLLYTREDEWVRGEGDRFLVGISDYAQQQLGDIVFVELPAVGSEIIQGQVFGVIESVKAVSDLYAPISGRVLEVNAELADRPELVNQDCYGDGWILIVDMRGEKPSDLLDAAAYLKHVEERSE
jgi:glycine cleavage system H protein